MMPDSKDLRYERNVRLQGFGEAGQQKLLQSTALVIGSGGLGSPVLYYLAAAGLGTIRIADGDLLEETNLNRQILHKTSYLNKDKVTSAENSINEFNPDCRIIPEKVRVTESNITDLLNDCDIVLDCTDNFESRFLIAEACWKEKIPLSYASAQGYGGQLLFQNPLPEKPCYRCLIPEIPADGVIPKPADTGVLGAVVGVMGSMQANEAIKYLLDIGTLADEEMLSYDGLKCRFVKIRRQKNPDCSLCSQD
ncbi:MAG: HesA/MoeB/ThiF family protein [Planctomycetota bacterium]|jgi:adenylyltransferase/sulfurtransferase